MGNTLFAVALMAGIVALQVVLLSSGLNWELFLTLSPLTAYLPVIVGVHVLSRAGFFQTTAIWALGLLVTYVLLFLREALLLYGRMEGLGATIVEAFCLSVAICLLLAVVCRFIRKPFRTYVLHNNTNWLVVCFPVLMVFVLFSYIDNSLTTPITWILIFLTALSVFIVVARVLTAAASASRMQAEQQAIAAQLDLQRREYEDICKKMELGRAYRHDMRHHLTVLAGLAGNENNEEITRYINDLDERIQETEQETYCENVTANAVLSSYLGMAKEAECTVASTIRIPAELPFDVLDICAVLANALENAIAACREISVVEDRRIELIAVFEDSGKFVLSTINPSKDSVSFDKEGLPLVVRSGEHGIGLKSIKSIADTYHGLFRCEYKEEKFHLSVVLLKEQAVAEVPKENRRPKKIAAATLMSPLMLCLALGSALVLQERAGVLDLDSLFQPERTSSCDIRWGDTALHIEMPKVQLAKEQLADAAAELQKKADEEASALAESKESAQQPAPQPPSGGFMWESAGDADSDPYASGSPHVIIPQPAPPDPSTGAQSPDPSDLADGVDEINRNMEEYVATLRDKFLWYVARKYNGYVAMDCTYTTLRNDGKLLSIRFDTTLNAGGSGQYTRTFMLDMRTGDVLELADLFTLDSDYINVISNDVLRQMTAQVQAGEADYFIPGGIWSPDECFKAISPDQNFYINNKDQLVIVFDEYEVAPGRDGMPEFIIPVDVLDAILQKPSLLK